MSAQRCRVESGSGLIHPRRQPSFMFRVQIPVIPCRGGWKRSCCRGISIPGAPMTSEVLLPSIATAHRRRDSSQAAPNRQRRSRRPSTSRGGARAAVRHRRPLQVLQAHCLRARRKHDPVVPPVGQRGHSRLRSSAGRRPPPKPSSAATRRGSSSL